MYNYAFALQNHTDYLNIQAFFRFFFKKRNINKKSVLLHVFLN